MVKHGWKESKRIRGPLDDRCVEQKMSERGTQDDMPRI